MLTEAEVIVKRQAIDQKLATGEPLAPDDVWFMGDHMLLDELTNYPACFDPYFRRLYLHYRSRPAPLWEELSVEHLHNLKFLVHEWLDQQQHAQYPDGSLAWVSQKETNKELVALRRKWHESPEIGEAEKDEDLFQLIAWSKFRFVLVRRIFEQDIKSDHYVLKLDGKEILFDYESALHVLSRHFAHGMKPYESLKDHFYGVFAHDKLHLEFENILNAIDQSGYYRGQDTKNINFRYNGEIYKIWGQQIDQTGSRFRISTFFPVSSPRRLDELNEHYDENPINDKLSIFVRK